MMEIQIMNQKDTIGWSKAQNKNTKHNNSQDQGSGLLTWILKTRTAQTTDDDNIGDGRNYQGEKKEDQDERGEIVEVKAL